MNYVKVYAIIVIANSFALILVYALLPFTRDYLLGEDKIIENVGAILFLCAFIYGSIYLAVYKTKRAYRILAFVTFLGLLGFLDEVSFGGRIFEFTYPRIYGVKFDGVHDLFYIAAKTVKILGDTFGYVVYFVVVISVTSVTIIVYKYKFAEIKRLYRAVLNYPPYSFLAIFATFIFLALVIDLGIIKSELLKLLEELLEMNAALALNFCCLSTKK